MAEIVVLGWGSLIWDPGDLNLKDGHWFDDGPYLPLEFSRISRDRGLALALYRGADPVRTLWSYMATENVGEAVWNLSQREDAKPENIGFLDLESGEYWCRTVDEHVADIGEWAAEKNRDGHSIGVIIWTDLKPDFERKTRRALCAENAIEYLKGLRPEKKSRAREYMEKAPPQVETEIRTAVRSSWDYIW